MSEPTFTEKSERLRLDMEARQAERQAGRAPKRTLADYAIGLSSLALLVVLLAAAVGIVALLVWLVVESVAAIVAFLGAVLVIVVASLAWQQIKGGK